MPGRTVTILGDDEWAAAGFAAGGPADPTTAALLAIDVQHYCLDPTSDLAATLARCAPAIFDPYRRRAAAMIENIGRLQRAFRGRGRPVVFTRHGALLPDGSDLTPRRRRREAETRRRTGGATGHLPVKGEPAHAVLDAVAPRPGEPVLDKNTSSAFNSTPIDTLLRNLGVRTLVLAGVAAEQCVLLTALDAADRGYEVVIAADACAGFDPGVIDVCFTHFRRVWGSVRSTAEVLDWMTEPE